MADFLSGYNTRQKLTVDNTKVDSDLFFFPCDVILRSTNFDFTKSTANGNDIRFCEANGITPIDFERERHESATAKAEYKTRLPFISSAAPTDSYLYYKNDPTISDGQNPTAVWDANTMARWGMGENPAGVAPQMKDSTVNANHGTSGGTMTSADSVEGKIGRALNLDGVNDYVNAGNDVSLGIENNLTISLWAKLTGTVGIHNTFIVSKKNAIWNQSAGYQVYYSPWNNGTIDIMGGGSYFKRHIILQDYLWHHWVMIWEGITLSVYQNGILLSGVYRGTPAAVISGADNLRIGRRDDASSHYVKGLIDEVRISNIDRSTAWIKASFNSGNNTLLTYGAEERSFILIGALTFSGTLTRTFFKTLIGALTFSGTLTRTFFKTLIGKLTFSGRIFSPPSFKESDVTNVKLEEDREKEGGMREL